LPNAVMGFKDEVTILSVLPVICSTCSSLRLVWSKRMKLRGSSPSLRRLFPSLFVRAITTMRADSSHMIRKQTGIPWIVLHHVPPKSGSNSSGEEAEAWGILVEYRPDYFLSGHHHAFPYTAGRSWSQRFDAVCLLVPDRLLRGQLLREPISNYIILDTESGDTSWHTTSETWIPEDGLYDHLVLKVTTD
jgi:hypothetical protein